MFIKDPLMFKYYFYECNKKQILKGTLRSEQKLMLSEFTNWNDFKSIKDILN